MSISSHLPIDLPAAKRIEAQRSGETNLQYNKIIYAAGVENEKRKRAYEAGKEAKHIGYGRISPYYEKPVLDQFFFGGFDGLTLEQTVRGVNNGAKLEQFFAEGMAAQ